MNAGPSEPAGLGFSGAVARRFQANQITPLLALLGLLLGIFAVLVTPREEEPQINVTFANVFIPFPGATAAEIEQLVATPAEQVLSEIEGIKHVYSTSRRPSRCCRKSSASSMSSRCRGPGCRS